DGAGDERGVHGGELHLSESGGALRELELAVRDRCARLLERLIPDGAVEEELLGLLAEGGAVEVIHAHLGEDDVGALRERHAEGEAAAVDPRLVLEQLADDAAKAAVEAGLLVGGDTLFEKRGAGDDLEDGSGGIERPRGEPGAVALLVVLAHGSFDGAFVLDLVHPLVRVVEDGRKRRGDVGADRRRPGGTDGVLRSARGEAKAGRRGDEQRAGGHAEDSSGLLLGHCHSTLAGRGAAARTAWTTF